MASSSSIHDIWRHNWTTLRRQPLAEVSGALGDLGTFLPIVVALTVGHQISLPTTLVLTGVYNILTGLFFGIPLPVQPMKAVAAVAILKSFTATEVAAAGIFVASCVFAFSIVGLLNWFSNTIPIPVVKGIQVGAGLSLIIAAGTKVLATLSWTGPSWSDNYISAIFAFLSLLAINTIGARKAPYALVVFVLGLIFAVVELAKSSAPRTPGFRVWHPYVQIPQSSDWTVGIVEAGIGQLPLTTLNSIIAVIHLSADLLPHVQKPSITHVGLSVAGMNLLGCWFGAMPVCHGSGGLAAQHRFGARSGSSIVLLGLFKLTVGLIFGESLVDLLRRFPTALLSIMVIAAGLELASVGESLNTTRARDISKDESMHGAGSDATLSDAERQRRWTVMLVTVALLVGFKNDAVGFIAGMCCHWSYEFPGLWRRVREKKTRQYHEEDQEALLARTE